jgi:hypothetical protein
MLPGVAGAWILATVASADGLAVELAGTQQEARGRRSRPVGEPQYSCPLIPLPHCFIVR